MSVIRSTMPDLREQFFLPRHVSSRERAQFRSLEIFETVRVSGNRIEIKLKIELVEPRLT